MEKLRTSAREEELKRRENWGRKGGRGEF